jgi:hypothetical protein
MGDSFHFSGPTSFINQPTDTIIQNFQNTYLQGKSETSGEVIQQLERLLRLILESQSISEIDKSVASKAIYEAAAEARKEDKGSRLVAILERIKPIAQRAADVGVPALTIISAVIQMVSR